MIESQGFIKLIFPNPVNFKTENRRKMAKFDKNDSCTRLSTSTLQKVRKCYFLKACNLLYVN